MKPEIKGLFTMATQAYKTKKYEFALQYYTMALRKHIRSNSSRHHHVLSDPLVLTLTVNSSAVLCHMGNYGDAFCMLNSACLSSLDDPAYFAQSVPHQLIPLIVKIVGVAYLSNPSQENEMIAVKYLQLIRNHYKTAILNYLPPEEACYIFLTEALLNLRTNLHESLDAFHSAFQLILEQNTIANVSIFPEISSMVLRLSSESVDHACSLSKSGLEITNKFMDTLDFACFLNILGISYIKAGRSLLAIEAFERALKLINSSNSIRKKETALHNCVKIYTEAAVSTNLSVAYHMADRNSDAYRWNWESLAIQAINVIENLVENEKFTNGIMPQSWILRYMSIFNRFSHLSLDGEIKLARKGFSAILYNEFPEVYQNCMVQSQQCGIFRINDFEIELLEILAMLLAADGEFDESWKLFLRCCEEITTAGDTISDVKEKQQYLTGGYCRVLDKMERCQPPSKIHNREFEEIRRFRMRTMSTSAIERSKRNLFVAPSLSNKNDEPTESMKCNHLSSKEPTADEAALVMNEMKKLLYMDGTDSSAASSKKRKKQRSLLQRIAGPTNQIKDVSSGDVNSAIYLPFTRQRPPPYLANMPRAMFTSQSQSTRPRSASFRS